MSDDVDPRICTNIGTGRYDHMLQPMREAIEHRMTALAPWSGLREVAEIGERITDALRMTNESSRHRALVSCQEHALRLEKHPSGLVQDAARHLKVHILAGFGLPLTEGVTAHQ